MTKKKLFLETYGCQMNFSDSEIVASILTSDDYEINDNYKTSDLILVNTCSVRENAEQRVRNRLREFISVKKKNPKLIIGIIGCMAERIKEQLFENEKMIDLVVGPDAYRNLPELIKNVRKGEKGINVALYTDETYSDISPVKIENNGVNAFISIMRGCENFCSYCVVPFTRGKERSRNPKTIIEEAKDLFNKGYREITLLGQNVNSYFWQDGDEKFTFIDLLESIANISPLLRVRFSTSHPKDLSDELIKVVTKYENICKAIHLPLQSGSSRILKLMNRKYTREWYIDRIETIKKYIPEIGLSTDIITGFCGETEEDHNDTLTLMKLVGYDYAFMFKYSERPNTTASKNLADDVPEEIKTRRHNEIMALQRKLSHESNIKDLNKTFKVLIEGNSKKSNNSLYGRNSQNKVIVFPNTNFKIGDYVDVKVVKCTSATLIGEICE